MRRLLLVSARESVQLVGIHAGNVPTPPARASGTRDRGSKLYCPCSDFFLLRFPYFLLNDVFILLLAAMPRSLRRFPLRRTVEATVAFVLFFLVYLPFRLSTQSLHFVFGKWHDSPVFTLLSVIVIPNSLARYA